MNTSSVLRNTAQPNTSPAPAQRTDNQGRDLAAEQLKRHEQAVTADLVSSAPGTYRDDLPSHSGVVRIRRCSDGRDSIIWLGLYNADTHL